MSTEEQAKKSIIARTLRMTGTVCFIGVAFTSRQYFQNQPPHTSPLKILPFSILYSMGMSILIAVVGQFMLWKAKRAARSAGPISS